MAAQQSRTLIPPNEKAQFPAGLAWLTGASHGRHLGTRPNGAGPVLGGPALFLESVCDGFVGTAHSIERFKIGFRGKRGGVSGIVFLCGSGDVASVCLRPSRSESAQVARRDGHLHVK